MRTSLPDLTFRAPSVDDAQSVLELMIRCDIDDYGSPDSDLDDLVHEWGQIDLVCDAWLAFTPEEKLVGYAAVLPWGSKMRYDVYVEPSWEDETLAQSLLARCEERALSAAQQGEQDSEVVTQIYVAHTNERMRKVIERAGFQAVNYVFSMQIQMDGPPPAPQWPEGITLRTTVAQQDDQAIHKLIEAAFDRPGRTPSPFEQWRDFMMRSDIFDAELWFLAIAAEEIVGACLCFPSSDRGRVRQLGVAPTWRKRGLGAALLRHSFAEFKKRGFERVGLTVAGDRSNAYKFYQNVGMKRIRQYDEYVKSIGTE